MKNGRGLKASSKIITLVRGASEKISVRGKKCSGRENLEKEGGVAPRWHSPFNLGKRKRGGWLQNGYGGRKGTNMRIRIGGFQSKHRPETRRDGVPPALPGERLTGLKSFRAGERCYMVKTTWI